MSAVAERRQVSEGDDVESIVQSILRDDYDRLEEAFAFRVVMNAAGFSAQSLADHLSRPGKGRGYIENALALLELKSDLQKLVMEQSVSIMSAKAINRVRDPKFRKELVSDLKGGIPYDKIGAKIKSFNGGAHESVAVMKGDLKKAATRLKSAAQRGSEVSAEVFDATLEPLLKEIDGYAEKIRSCRSPVAPPRQ